MDNGSQITEETKNGIYKQIIDIMLVSLENGSLSAQESEDVSAFALQHIDNAPSQDYIDSFLNQLSLRWPCFSPLLSPLHEKESRLKDEQSIQNLKNEINSIAK